MYAAAKIPVRKTSGETQYQEVMVPTFFMVTILELFMSDPEMKCGCYMSWSNEQIM
jgi:hypothetical protein